MKSTPQIKICSYEQIWKENKFLTSHTSPPTSASLTLPSTQSVIHYHQLLCIYVCELTEFTILWSVRYRVLLSNLTLNLSVTTEDELEKPLLVSSTSNITSWHFEHHITVDFGYLSVNEDESVFIAFENRIKVSHTWQDHTF